MFNARHRGFILAALVAAAFCTPVYASGGAKLALPPGCPYPALSITLDAYDVPTISGDSTEACFFGAGYMHGYHRLVQLDVTRRMGRGELAGLVGESQLDNDKMYRRLGLADVAEKCLALLTPEEKNALDAYTAGVNFYLEHCAELPVEFLLLGPPRKWTDEDTLIAGRVMSWMLMDDFYSTVSWDWNRARIDPALLPLVDLSPTVGISSHFSDAELPETWDVYSKPFEIPTAVEQHEPIKLSAIIGLPCRAATTINEFSEQMRGSNCFVISGSLTADGKPILASDPHLDLTFPPIWYEVHMIAPDFEAQGMTVPGIPAVIIGRNRDIAWGITALGGDVADAIRYKVRKTANADASGSSQEYLTNDGWKPFIERTETYEITDLKGKRTVRETVRETEAGPVVYDEGETVIALKWVGMFPDREGAAVLAMDRARNIDEFRVALEGLSTSQNILYCDNTGHIAYFPVGKYPKRNYDGSAVVIGESTDTTWSEFTKSIRLPYLVDPLKGYIASANQPVGPEYRIDVRNRGVIIGRFAVDSVLGGYRAYGHRAKRISDLIDQAKSRGKITRDDVARIQCDTYSITGAGFRDFAAKTLSDASYAPGATDNPIRVAYDMLVNWDGRCDADSAGAAVENLMIHFVSLRLLKPRGYFSTYERVWDGGLRFGANLGALWDDPATKDTVEDAPAILSWALEQSASALTDKCGEPDNWRWDAIHKMDLSYPIPVIGMFAPGLVPSPGGNDTVWMGSAGLNGDGVFIQDFGPSMRLIISPGIGDGAAHSTTGDGNGESGDGYLSILPGGESGNPQNEHSKDQLPLYLKGEYK